MRVWRRSAWLFCLWLAAANAKSRNRFDGFPGGRPPSSGGSDAWVQTVPVNRPVVGPNETPSSAISKNTFASSLSFLHGLTDVCCFRMSRCFANMMTGNSINFATAVAEMRRTDALRLGSVVLCYALGNGGYRAMVHLHHRESRPNKEARAMASLFSISLLALSDYLFYTKTLVTKSMIHPIPLALAFGLLNAGSMDALGGTITFTMTGHIKTISQGIADLLFHPDLEKRKWQPAQNLSTRLFASFLAGIAVGTILANQADQTKIEGSGMSLASFLLEARVPIFMTVGILSAILVHLYDHPLPTPVRNLWALVSDRTKNIATSKEDKVQLSVNLL